MSRFRFRGLTLLAALALVIVFSSINGDLDAGSLREGQATIKRPATTVSVAGRPNTQTAVPPFGDVRAETIIVRRAQLRRRAPRAEFAFGGIQTAATPLRRLLLTYLI
ncbi:MAG TPA: hypothetical protein VGS96_06035 [Thermoanaerobaculia bacterium]|jgi:hypothetical protein|nr:hypothetical protein [Thermoanaerobaculia bacterium]